jgi:glucose/arabinose dehydrogenase
MKYYFLTVGLMFIFGVESCHQVTPSVNAAHDSDSTILPSVEKAKANTNYQPAFTGQYRVPAVGTKTEYQTERIAQKLGSVFAIVAMPDGRLMITFKSGSMEIRNQDGKLVKKITGFPPVVNAGQGGLLDMAFDPHFETNKLIYWSYSAAEAKANLTAVAKGVLNEKEGRVEQVRLIFKATPAINSNLHFGSRLVFDKQGYLFVSVGEKFIPEGRVQAQDVRSGLGKIFKITTEGKPAPGNPYINKPPALPEIFSHGHRNVQGLDIDPVSGRLWEVEFGPRGGDEVNLIDAGKNYGWPVITYGLEYSGEKIGAGIQTQKGMEQPVYYWDPSISPSGICFYKGNQITEWKNDLFIAALSGQHIARLKIVNNKVVGEERLLTDKKQRFRDITYTSQQLFALTDGGDIYRIRKK